MKVRGNVVEQTYNMLIGNRIRLIYFTKKARKAMKNYPFYEKNLSFYNQIQYLSVFPQTVKIRENSCKECRFSTQNPSFLWSDSVFVFPRKMNRFTFCRKRIVLSMIYLQDIPKWTGYFYDAITSKR